MTAPVLFPRHVFGLKSDVSCPLQFLDDSEVVYAAGHQLVVANIHRRQQRFIPATDRNGSQGLTTITAIALTDNRKFLAMAERSQAGPIVTIIDARTLKKRRSVTVSITGNAREFIHLCFSKDNKHLIGLASTASGSVTVVEYHWHKEQITAQSTVQWPAHCQPTKVSYHPLDSSRVVVTGRGVLSLLTVDWDTTSINPVNDSGDVRIDGGEEVTGHSWIVRHAFSADTTADSTDNDADDSADHSEVRLVTVTSQGTVRVFDDSSCQRTKFYVSDSILQVDDIATHRLSSNSQPLPPAKSIYSVTGYIDGSNNTMGFAVGCDGGIVQLYSYSDIAGCTMRHCQSLPNHPAPVIHLVLPRTSNSTLIAVTDTQQAFKLAQPLSLNGGKNNGIEIPIFIPMLCSNHTGAITGLDVCVRKPLIATCGVDRSVRLYNSFTLECELVAFFPEQPLSLSFHPSGLYLLIGFADKLRLCSVLLDSLVAQKEFPIKNCVDCAFSHGGHCLAAVNGALIQVYHTYTGEQLAVFRGHTALVKSLSWSDDDQRIVSAGSDGAVYQRKLGSSARLQELVQKGCKFSCALSTSENKLYAVGDDRMLKEIVDKSLNKTLDAGVELTQIAINSRTPQRMLVAGTINGVIRSFAFPLTGIVKDYQCHSKAITRLRITHDDSLLVSVSEDGTMALYALKAPINDDWNSLTLPITVGLELSDGLPYSDEVLVSRSNLDESSALLLELQNRVDELRASNDYQLRLHEMNYSEKLKEVTEKYILQLEHDRSKCEMIGDESKELEAEFEDRLSTIKNSLSEKLQHEDLAHQQAMMKQITEFQLEQREIQSKKERENQRILSIVEQQKTELADIEHQLTERLVLAQQETKLVVQSIERVKREFDESAHQAAVDYDAEIEQLKSGYNDRLMVERDSTLRFKGENGIMRKKLSVVAKEIEEVKESLRAASEKEDAINAAIEELEARIAAQKKEMKEKDRRIADCERLITELKKDNQELEKFKFVLDSQIKELKREIEPREQEIGRIQGNIADIDSQLERQHSKHSQLQLRSQQQEADNRHRYERIERIRNHNRHQHSQIRRFQRLVEEAARMDAETGNFDRQLATIIKEFGSGSEGAGKSSATSPSASLGQSLDNSVAKEAERHRLALESHVTELKKLINNSSSRFRLSQSALVGDNIALIKEIHAINQSNTKEKKLTTNRSQLVRKVKRDRETASPSKTSDAGRAVIDDQSVAESEKLVLMQRNMIVELREEIERLERLERDRDERLTLRTPALNHGAMALLTPIRSALSSPSVESREYKESVA